MTLGWTHGDGVFQSVRIDGHGPTFIYISHTSMMRDETLFAYWIEVHSLLSSRLNVRLVVD